MIAVTAFYQFAPWSEEVVAHVRSELEKFAAESDLVGLVLLSREGINATVSGSPETILGCKELLATFPGCDKIFYKDSACEKQPFRRFKIDLRQELVTYDPTIVPDPKTKNHHLTPAEWHEMLQQKDIYLLDTRNWYEVDLGKFKGAIDPRIENFTELKEHFKKLTIPKDTKVMMYCTGGVRCEKALIDMQRLGYENVYQLEGGILKYFEEFPDTDFEGECFVFDHRVAVDQQLQPTKKYQFCPHCGQPGTIRVQCGNCERVTTICHDCARQADKNTCSKNCAHHFRRTKMGAEGAGKVD